MKCYYNSCCGEGKVAPCCHDCSKDCPDRCPFKVRTACIWLVEGKEHDTEENETGTGEEDPDLH